MAAKYHPCLPEEIILESQFITTCGFAFDESSDDYKVVAVLHSSYEGDKFGMGFSVSF